MIRQDFRKVVMSQLYSHLLQPRNTPAEMMRKHQEGCSLRPVKADQSEKSGLLGKHLHHVELIFISVRLLEGGCKVFPNGSTLTQGIAGCI